MTDRQAFIKVVRNENKRFRPLGKYVTEFTRQIEAKQQPSGIFAELETTKRPKREVQLGKSQRTVTKVFRVHRVNAQQLTFTHLNDHL